ncbi:MAG TPA: antitoxin [Acidimicrobiales bacterium]|nr:antitoxin [Acidimicrobiales bacterium]
MGFLDKAKDALQGKSDEAAKALDKAGDVIDDKTGGKYTDKIDQAVDKASDVLDDIDKQND